MIFQSDLAKELTLMLSQEESIADAAIEAVDRNGVVTLTGTAPSNEIKRKAEAIVRRHDDVLSITNEIEVRAGSNDDEKIVMATPANEAFIQ